MKKDFPIGFFDSGVGGLSVYSQFKKVLPYENTIYFGDLKNLPYGNKSKDELVVITKNILDFFKTKNVKAVVIACNTSSALAYEQIKDCYDFEIFPIIQSCAKIISQNNYKKLGIFATEGTVKSEAYKNEIQKYNPNIEIKEIACHNWVSIVEGFYPNKCEDIVKHLDEMLSFSPDKIILGCTHYPYLLNDLAKYVDKNIFVDPAEIFIEYLKNNIIRNDEKVEPTEEFYVSANPNMFIKNAKLFYKLKKTPILY